MQKIPVLDDYGRKVFDRSPAEAARMVALHKMRWSPDHRCLRFIGPTREHEHPCRTHTSRGGMLAAIGRGQQYTTSTHGRVDGFKRIFPEDLGTFHTATLDCMKVGHWRVISISIQSGGKMHHLDFGGTNDGR